MPPPTMTVASSSSLMTMTSWSVAAGPTPADGPPPAGPPVLLPVLLPACTPTPLLPGSLAGTAAALAWAPACMAAALASRPASMAAAALHAPPPPSRAAGWCLEQPASGAPGTGAVPMLGPLPVRLLLIRLPVTAAPLYPAGRSLAPLSRTLACCPQAGLAFLVLPLPPMNQQDSWVAALCPHPPAQQQGLSLPAGPDDAVGVAAPDLAAQPMLQPLALLLWHWLQLWLLLLSSPLQL